MKYCMEIPLINWILNLFKDNREATLKYKLTCLDIKDAFENMEAILMQDIDISLSSFSVALLREQLRLFVWNYK